MTEESGDKTFILVSVKNGDIKVDFNGSFLMLRGLLQFADDRVRDAMDNQTAMQKLANQKECEHLEIKPPDESGIVYCVCGFKFPDHDNDPS